MKLLVNMSWPLAAAILLLACGSRETGDPTPSDTRAQDMRTVARATPPSVAAGQSPGAEGDGETADSDALDSGQSGPLADESALDPGEAGADGSIAADAGTAYSNDAGGLVLVGECRACAESRCPQQFE